MNDHQSGAEDPPRGASGDDRLDSWKRIAAYLKRDVTTVQRWERREAMPVHRHRHEKQGSVYAYRSELDAWWASRGNRLNASDEIPEEPASGSIPPAAESAASVATGVKPYRNVLMIVLVVGVLATGFSVWYARKSGYFWRDPLRDAKVVRLTDFGGDQEAAAISRDGRYVAFLSDRDGHMDAFSTEIGSNRYRNLTNGQISEASNSSLRAVDFSPDGSLVTIWARSAAGSRPEDIKVMGAPTSGGPLRVYMPDIAEFDWSADGTHLVYHTTAPGDPIFVRAKPEEPAKQIYIAPPGIHCHFPTWAPDDGYIYFVRGQPPADWDIWRLLPTGAGLERMTFLNTRVSYPVMLDPRTLLYLATDPDGSGPWMYVMDVPLRRAHRVSMGLDRYTSLAASDNGNRLVASVGNSRADLWRVSLGNGTAPQSTAVPLAPEFQSAVSPRIGLGYVAYVSTGGGRRGIWKLVDGTATALWNDPTADRVGAPAIAPDGRHIAFTVERREATQLYVMDSDGQHPRVIATALALRGNLAWTPDSLALVGAIVRDGEPRLSKIFPDGSPPQPMASEYSLDPAWSPDGKYFVYSGVDVGTTFPLRASGPDGRPYEMRSFVLTRGARRVVFLASGGLVILRGEIGHKNFWLLDPQSGSERQLTDLPSNFVIGDFDVSRDGTEILFDRVQDSSSIALIERSR